MIAVLLLPAALGAILAIVVPLAIHIARRTETRTIDFAALRWLNPDPKPVRRLQLDERWLLAVRIALIVALALALARPVLRPTGDDRPVVAVSPDVDASQVSGPGERRVWLAPGFPSLAQSPPTTPDDLPSLIRQLDAEIPAGAPLAVVVPAELNADAQRLALSRKVDWRIAPAARRSPPPLGREPPALFVRYAPANEVSVGYFRAAASAFAGPAKAPSFDAAPVGQPLPQSARSLIWLSGAPLSDATLAWVERGGVVLLAHDAPSPVEGAQDVIWRDALGEPLVLAGRYGEGRVLRLTRPLEPRSLPALVEPDFPDRLWSLLDPAPEPVRVAASDYAPSMTGQSAAHAYNPHPTDLRPWMALIVAALFAAERWLATRRRRPVAA